MAYKALYRSYRPTTFKEVIGQKHVVQTLKNAVIENKISHAYVFSGLRGIGKTTIARILAKAVNCENPVDGEPCNCCGACKAINNLETTDIVELDAASNNGVDEIRNILDKVNFLPSFLTKKVYIIDEVHMLSSAAFNALLKTLEEPPAYVMFILATTEPHKIPLTILSRCQRFDFKQLTIKELTTELKYICDRENIKISEDAMNGIAEAAEGGMRDALSILDQASVYSSGEVVLDDVNSVTGNISNKKLIDLIRAFNDDNATQAINIVDELLNMGKEVSRLTTGLIQFCRDILLYKSVNNVSTEKNIYNTEEFKQLARESDANRLFYYIDVLVDVQNKIRFTNSQKIYLEVGIMKIVNSVSQDIDILGRIKALEDQASFGGGYANETAPMMGVSPTLINQITSLENKIKKISSEFERANVSEFENRVNTKLGVLEDVVSKTSVLPESIDERVQILENRLNEVEKGTVLPAEQFENDSYETKDQLSRIENELKTKSLIIDELASKINNSYKANNSNSDNDAVILEIIEKIEQLEKTVNDINNSDNNSGKEALERIKELEASINSIYKQAQQISADSDNNQNHSLENKEVSDDGYVQMSLLDFLTPEQAGDFSPEYKKNNRSENYSSQIDELRKEMSLFKEEILSMNQNSSENSFISSTEEYISSDDLSAVITQIDSLQGKIDTLEEKINNLNVLKIESPSASINNEVTEVTTIRELKTNYFVLTKTLELLTEKLDSIKNVPSVNNIDNDIYDSLELTRNEIIEIQDILSTIDEKYVSKKEYNSLVNMCNTLELGLTSLSSKVDFDTEDHFKKRTNPFEKPITPIDLDEVENEKEVDQEIKNQDTLLENNSEEDKEIYNNENEDLLNNEKSNESLEEKSIYNKEEDQQPTLFDFVDKNDVTDLTSEETLEEKDEGLDVSFNGSSEENDKPIESVITNNEDKTENLEELEDVKEDSQNEVQNDAAIYTNENEISDDEPLVEDDEEDLTAKIYDISIVENILHESRLPECRQENREILSKWNNISDLVSGELAGISSLLASGELRANGKVALLISYANAQLCNHIMEPKNHNDACAILKEALGKSYDFIALPDDLWMEIRVEYHNQYRNNIKYPKLSPINREDLHIVKVSKEPALTERQKTLKKAESFFGTDD